MLQHVLCNVAACCRSCKERQLAVTHYETNSAGKAEQAVKQTPCIRDSASHLCVCTATALYPKASILQSFGGCLAQCYSQQSKQSLYTMRCNATPLTVREPFCRCPQLPLRPARALVAQCRSHQAEPRFVVSMYAQMLKQAFASTSINATQCNRPFGGM